MLLIYKYSFHYDSCLMKEKSQLLKGIPVLVYLDINGTREYYKEKLGWDRIDYTDDTYPFIASNHILHF